MNRDNLKGWLWLIIIIVVLAVIGMASDESRVNPMGNKPSTHAPYRF